MNPKQVGATLWSSSQKKVSGNRHTHANHLVQFTQTRIPRRLLNYATVFVCGVWVCALIFSAYRWGGVGEGDWQKQTWTGSLGKLWSLWPLRVNYVSGGNLLIWLQNTAPAPVLSPLLHSGVLTELWTSDPTAHLGPHEIHYLFD